MNRYIVLFLSVFTLIQSCEDPIDVNLPTTAPRLVIEASLDWEKGTSGNEQSIKLSLSTPFFETETHTTVTGATVSVTNENTGDIFAFTDQNDGTYTTNTFVPLVNNTYRLDVAYNGENYRATETLMPVVDIKNVTQSTEDGFDDEALELNFYFDDPEDEENHYLIKWWEQGDKFPYFVDLSDEFSNGNEMNGFIEKMDDDEDEDGEKAFEPGDEVYVNLYGISEQYYNFMRILIEQYESQGNPFSSSAVQIRGNCVNPVNPDKYAYGYFRLSQVSKVSYMFQ
ncbi:MAG: DUF4249 domain-containing protein [Aestuariibaculum sp.]